MKGILLAVRHIPQTKASKPTVNSKVCGKSLSAFPYDSTRFRTGRKVLIHLDSFKINPTYNTDGMDNWLRRARIG